jgi:maltooligosyltrehalose trehalohydrolase
VKRKLPVGAEILGDLVSFRVWAPERQIVRVAVGPSDEELHKVYDLSKEGNGYFSAEISGPKPGDLYGFRLDDLERIYPDPASRFQPFGPHGYSQIVDPFKFAWSDQDWKGIPKDGQVVYEMHIGTFTREGTYAAAQKELHELRQIGITVVEVMPVADFVGDYGWGYDGVNMFAPTRLYGTPDELKAFIDTAHRIGLGVILDVVYNHFGSDGNYIGNFTRDYFSREYSTEWGESLNYDGVNSGPVREFFISNAGYWIDEFHFDGLRLDATQQIFDSSPTHVLKEICDKVRSSAEGKSTMIVGENQPQDVRLITSPEAGGYGLDCLWNDDFHHSAKVAITGKNEHYYADFLGAPQELISTAKYGFLYQGQYSICQNAPRGTPNLRLSPNQLVTFIDNHDQIANSGKGLRAHMLTSLGQYKAMMTFLLLSPSTPMLFQGQEFASSSPFTYFADHEHEPELAEAIAKGRKESLANFRSMNNKQMLETIPLPHDRKNFESCKLDFSDRQANAGLYLLTKELLRLRREDRVFSRQHYGTLDGAVLNEDAFVIRFFGAADSGDRLLCVNMGRDLHLPTYPQPLTAAPLRQKWTQILSTEEPCFDGSGAPDCYENGRLYLSAHSAVVLRSIDLE